jgi:hypothetical protein
VPGPRLYGIPATAADVVAVVRRGPSSWCRLGRWDVAAGAYEPGAWLRGALYPQRCDLSPDGRFLAYFALQSSASWELGWTYVAISRLPWLAALAAWGTDGTWTRGIHFVSDPSVRQVEQPDHGSLRYDVLAAGIAITRPASYSVERRRGWTEVEGSPERAEDDLWDERRARALRMRKVCPVDRGVQLEVTGWYAAFRSGEYSHDVAYAVVDRGRTELLSVQWADWARDGNLLVATDAGELQTRSRRDWSRPATVVADLSEEVPKPAAPATEARSWPGGEAV